jgi:hypothetical protein
MALLDVPDLFILSTESVIVNCAAYVANAAETANELTTKKLKINSENFKLFFTATGAFPSFAIVLYRLG